MPRPAKLWRKTGRAGWWATIAGKQVCFGEDRKEAEVAFHRAKARAGPIRRGARVRVDVAVDRYIDEARERISPKTLAGYRESLQAWIDHHGNMACDALTAEHLKAWLKNPAWNRSTRRTRGGAVKSWAKWCVREKILDADPFVSIRLPGVDRRKPPAPGELDAILAAANAEFRDFLTVCVEVGCRPGEARTLTAARIDVVRSTAMVTGKTGERLVGLSGKALAVLVPLMAKYPEGPVLRTGRGNPWSENAYQRRMREIRGRLGLGPVVVYHARHAYWARATKAGVGDIAVAKQLGHSDLRMLAKVYSEADHQIMAEAARKASGEVPAPAPVGTTSGPGAARRRPRRRIRPGRRPRRRRGAGSTGRLASGDSAGAGPT
jgi:integrase